jgi:FkbM family methyltransferase
MSVLALDQHRALVFGRDGFYLVNRHDFYMGQALETYGEYGQAEANTLQVLISEGDTVIEVGANIGSHTVGLAKKVGRGGKVYAYEPQRQCHALLQAQVALNHLDQVIAIPEGCGSQEGTMWHAPCDYDQRGNFGSVSLVGEERPGFFPVKVRTLDSAHRGENIRMMKVDVEGMEFEVLSGARQIIAAQKPILYLENDRVENSRRLIGLVHEMGYRAWWHVCPLFNPNNYFGQAKNIYDIAHSFNMVCMPAETQLPADVFSGEVDINKRHPLEPA